MNADSPTPRRAAQLLNTLTYIGAPCESCNGRIRYTSCKNCVPCAILKSKRQYLKKKLLTAPSVLQL